MGQRNKSVFKPEPGTQLSPSIERVLKVVEGLGESMILDFNGTEVEVFTGDTYETVYDRWLGERE